MINYYKRTTTVFTFRRDFVGSVLAGELNAGFIRDFTAAVFDLREATGVRVVRIFSSWNRHKILTYTGSGYRHDILFLWSAVYFSKGIPKRHRITCRGPIHFTIRRLNCGTDLSSPGDKARKIISNIPVKFTLGKFSQPPWGCLFPQTTHCLDGFTALQISRPTVAGVVSTSSIPSLRNLYVSNRFILSLRSTILSEQLLLSTFTLFQANILPIWRCGTLRQVRKRYLQCLTEKVSHMILATMIVSMRFLIEDSRLSSVR